MTETIIQNEQETAPELGMDLHLHTIPLQRIHQIWSAVEPFLAAGLEEGQETRTDYTLDQVKASLALGYWQLVVATDGLGDVYGACAIDFINRPNDRVAYITTIGGRGIINEQNKDRFFDLLRKCGATLIEVAARDSAARLFGRFGLSKKYTVMEKPL